MKTHSAKALLMVDVSCRNRRSEKMKKESIHSLLFLLTYMHGVCSDNVSIGLGECPAALLSV